MLQGEALIVELMAIDGSATGSAVVCEVASLISGHKNSSDRTLDRSNSSRDEKNRHLSHNSRDDSVETTTFVAKAVLPGAQGSEILCMEENTSQTIRKQTIRGAYQQSWGPHQPSAAPADRRGSLLVLMLITDVIFKYAWDHFDQQLKPPEIC